MTSNANEYDRVYAKRLYDVRSVYDHIIRIRQRYFDKIERGAKILDHGFGNGVISAYLAEEGFEPYGVESSASATDLIHERASELGVKPDNFRLIAHSETRMPFDDGCFAGIVSNQVLYFLEGRDKIDQVVKDWLRILRRGGRVACTIMAENNYYFTKCGMPPVPDQGMVKVVVRGRIDRDYELYRFRDANEVRKCFENAGFVVDDLGYFDFRLLDVGCAKHHIVLAHKP